MEEPQQYSAKDFTYWMGRVDGKLGELSATLIEVKGMLAGVMAWRETVNERLSAGNQKFDGLERRLLLLEKVQTKEANDEEKEKENENDGDTNVKWKEFRDKLMWPIVIGFLYLLLFELVPQLIKLIQAHPGTTP